jgi:predicted HicB family RNase H-like nuclease
MRKTETLNLRVSAEFKRRLADEAAKERRSVTNYLEVTMTKIWDQKEAKRQTKAAKLSQE